jgi:sigma-E factor negative regulatory protein RseC
MFIEVNNHLQAKTGDHVEIKMPTGSFLKLSLLVYILPIVSLIAGAYFGTEISAYLHFDSAPVSIAGGAMAMIVAFTVLRMIDRSAQSTEKYQPRMTRILVNVKAF